MGGKKGDADTTIVFGVKPEVRSLRCSYLRAGTCFRKTGKQVIADRTRGTIVNGMLFIGSATAEVGPAQMLVPKEMGGFYDVREDEYERQQPCHQYSAGRCCFHFSEGEQ
jgi:hypothetical protein